ncbi:F0F1 ATP synthase subunit I [Pasteurellaceae bacterium Pebbles2]|nr:F0F1 ATP synthase subunit I [Pasteurellaceae bacterium Pebbles2]
MSAVIHRAKQHYLKSLKTEFAFILLLALLCFFWQKSLSISFLNGLLASFLPHCLFVYWFFFRETTKNQTKMTALYRGEGIKWLVTILMIVASFKFISEISIIAFFVGYVISLILNNFIPFILSSRK